MMILTVALSFIFFVTAEFEYLLKNKRTAPTKISNMAAKNTMDLIRLLVEVRENFSAISDNWRKIFISIG
nr:MAG: hypothetical protein DIU64_07705 [Caldicoprobacter oshimai]